MKGKNNHFTKIGWIGTGVMGSSMFSHILKAGYTGMVYNRTKEKAGEVIRLGAEWTEKPAILAAQCDIIFTIVGYPEDVRELYFGEEGLINSAGSGSILVDMTTSSPGLAKEIYTYAMTKGIHTLDAPVSGGDTGAINASLSIMTGGNKEVFETILPLFKLMGDKITYQGVEGSGQNTKMCNQIAIAGTMIGVCESLLYGYQSGLDMKTMLKAISGGAAACWTLDNLAPRILKQDYDPGFYVEHFIKDMSIALEEARKMNIVLPGLALVQQLYISLVASGHGKKGTQALMLALKKISDTNG